MEFNIARPLAVTNRLPAQTAYPQALPGDTDRRSGVRGLLEADSRRKRRTPRLCLGIPTEGRWYKG